MLKNTDLKPCMFVFVVSKTQYSINIHDHFSACVFRKQSDNNWAQIHTMGLWLWIALFNFCLDSKLTFSKWTPTWNHFHGIVYNHLWDWQLTCRLSLSHQCVKVYSIFCSIQTNVCIGPWVLARTNQMWKLHLQTTPQGHYLWWPLSC